MAKKSKSKSTATSLDASPAPSLPATAAGTSTALASSSTNNAAMESSTGSIASTSTSSRGSQIDSGTKQVRAVEVAEDEDAEELPEIQVNKWSLHDLKTACDDAVKQVCSDISSVLSLCSYSSCLCAPCITVLLQTIPIQAVTCAYRRPTRTRMDSEHDSTRSKLVRVQSTISTIKRLRLSSCSAVYHTQRHPRCICQICRKGHYIRRQKKSLCWKSMLSPVIYIQVLLRIELTICMIVTQIETQALKITSSCEPYTPIYNLNFSYTHSSNGGKSLIREFKKDISKPFNEVFDEEGVLVRSELEKTLKSAIDQAIGQ